MAKNLERRMTCKNCNQVEIGKDPADGKWYEVQNDTQLHTYKCPNSKFKGKQQPVNTAQFETRLSNLEQAVKALVATSGGQSTL